MLKLYKRIKDKLLYHEAWENDKGITEHWGTVGDRGEIRDHPPKPGLKPNQAIKKVLENAAKVGFKPIADDDHAVLLIEYLIDGFGTDSQLELRHELQDRLEETLGWTGLGHCDGGSIGSGTMEVCCYVVDFDIARAVIEKDLKRTKFRGYSRIINEGE
jgi:hypothetical protein